MACGNTGAGPRRTSPRGRPVVTSGEASLDRAPVSNAGAVPGIGAVMSDIEAEGLEAIAQGLLKLARARRSQPAADDKATWIDPAKSPLGKRRTLALARTGDIESTKVGKRVLVSRASLEAFLAQHKRGLETEGENLFGASS